MSARNLKLVMVALFTLASIGTVVPQAHASSCNSALNVIGGDILRQMSTILQSVGCTAAGGTWDDCYASAKKRTEIAEKSLEYWKTMSKNSWANLGARSLAIGDKEHGTLVGTSGRLFITTTTMPYDSARLIITERGGKSKVGVAICMLNSSGTLRHIKDVTLNGSKAAKKDKNESHEYLLDGVQGAVLQVHLDAKSVSNSFKYDIEIVPVP